MNIKNLLKTLIGINNIKHIKSWIPSDKKNAILKQRRIFYSQFLEKGNHFFDIGTNYGNRIEPLITQGIKIVAEEPQKECADYLNKKYRKKITVLQNGLGEKVENKLMYIASNAYILSSFSKDWINSTKQSGRFNKIKWNEKREIQIQMTTLDHLMDFFCIPDVIKIDVEGYETVVLKGFSRPEKVLSIEYSFLELKDILIDFLLYVNELSNSTVKFNYGIGENTEFFQPNGLDFDKIL